MDTPLLDAEAVKTVLAAFNRDLDDYANGNVLPDGGARVGLHDGDVLTFGWLTYDPFAGEDYWSDYGENGELLLYPNRRFAHPPADELNARIDACNADGTPYLIVSLYDHGNVHFSVAGTRWYPDAHWDMVHAAGIYIPYKEAGDAYKASMATGDDGDAALTLAAAANAVLHEYSAWCNGEVYRVFVCAISLSTGEMLAEDSCGGYIGNDAACEALTEMVRDTARAAVKRVTAAEE